MGQQPFRKVVDPLRAELGLPAMKPTEWLDQVEAARWPICYGYSPVVVPQPADWPEWNHTVGYWWPAPDPDFKLAPELVDFIAAGPAPVYIGFGSMPAADKEALSALIVSALRKSRLRAVVNSGWAGLAAGALGVLRVLEDLSRDGRRRPGARRSHQRRGLRVAQVPLERPRTKESSRPGRQE